MGIHQNSSDSCGVRQEGCRAIAKCQGRLGGISCRFGSNSGSFNKIGVVGSRFLRGVTGSVFCD